mgnify:CR=1 FL=1
MLRQNAHKRAISHFFLTGILSLVPCITSAVAPPEWTVSFAENIFNAWRAGTPMPQMSAAHPDASLDDAYLVQRHFVKRMLETEILGGYKAAGVANPDADFPLVGVMLNSGIRHATDNVVIDLALDPHRHVENEIGYVFGKAINAPVEDIETLRRHVKAVLAIVELPGHAVEARQPATTNDIVAWNANAKEMILGEEKNPAEIDPDNIAITLTRDGERINEARGDMAAGGQWRTLLKAVNHLLRQGYAIQPGQVITNGALGKILKAEPGRYRADYGPLGVIEFEVRGASGESVK